MKRRILCYLAVLMSFSCYSRGYYELKFYDQLDNQRTYYVGLLLFFDDSSSLNKLRISYSDDGINKLLVEEDVKIEFQTKLGLKYRILRCSNPRFIIDNDNVGDYSPDVFLFKQQKNGFFAPDHGESIVETFGLVVAHITSFKPVKKITEKYLKAFKWNVSKTDILVLDSLNKIEVNRPALISSDTTRARIIDSARSTIHISDSLLQASSGPTPSGGKSSIYLLLVTNTKAPDIGKSCKQNQSLLTEEFKDIAEITGCTLKTLTLDDNRFELFSLSKTIHDLQVGANDGVILYYSGHGFRKTSDLDSFPFLDFRHNQQTEQFTTSNVTTLRSVYEQLKTKNPKFLLVFGECCNIDLDIEVATNELPLQDPSVLFAPAGLPISKFLATKLLDFHGKILVGTAHPHQYSYYFPTTGGIYMKFFLDALSKSINVTNSTFPVSWPSILQWASAKTNSTVQTFNSDFNEQAVWVEIEQ